MAQINKSSLSISIGVNNIKVAQLSSAGAVQKVAFEPCENPADAPSSLQKALKGMSHKGVNTICIVPSAAVTSKNIEIPSTDPEEIGSIINLQAARHTPFSKDEILIGFINIGSYKDGHTRVLLVIVKRDVIKEKLDILTQAGLDPDQVSFVPEGVARFYARFVPNQGSVRSIIDVGYESTNFIIESRSTAVATRNIPVGIKSLAAEGQSARDKLIEEIKTSLDGYKEEDIDALPNEIVLTDRHSEVSLLENDLKEALGVNVSFHPFLDLVKVPAPIKARLTGDLADYSFLEVIAPGAMAAKNEVNLVPEETKIKRELARKGRDIVKTGVLAVLLFIIVGVYMFSKVYFQQTFLKNNLQAKYAGEQEQVDKLEKQMLRARLVREFLAKRGNSLEVIEEIYKLIPNEVYLSSIALEDESTLSIQGVADSMSRVYSLPGILKKSKLFTNVEQRSATPKKEKGKTVGVFEFACTIKDKTFER